MSTYYEYRDVKVMIAHKLMKMEGWKVYGYKEDESDGMTDYYSPANWDGVAEKNGYILCVNVYGAREKQEIRKYNYNNFSYDNSIMEKINKLKNMTVERGASEQEEESAKKMILSLQKKAEGNAENNNKYVVIGHIPAHQANPPRMNWHIEKDGIIVAKGNGILKYARVDNYFSYDVYRKSYEDFKKLSKEEYIQKDVDDSLRRGYYTDIERARSVAESNYEDMQSKAKLIEQFNNFINKLDTTCGNLVGNGEIEQYEKVIVTEYKKENKVVEIEEGEVKEGQLFMLKGNFNYGCRKGLVYRIHETEYNGKKSYHAYNLNRKLTKELTGRSTPSNRWNTFGDRFDNWIEKGLISWCKIEEVKTPYEVEKVVKKKVNNAKKNTKQTTDKTDAEEIDIKNLTFEITEDVDTRDNSKIYVVKIKESLNREDYQKVNSYMKSIGGYYSRFKKGFIFKENPNELLKGNVTKVDNQEVNTEETTEKETSINYNIIEDIHTKTGEKLYIVKPDAELSKTEFAKVRQKLATIQGYYSSFKKGFIFKYDPTEKLEAV